MCITAAAAAAAGSHRHQVQNVVIVSSLLSQTSEPANEKKEL